MSHPPGANDESSKRGPASPRAGISTPLATGLSVDAAALIRDDDLVGRLDAAYDAPVRGWTRTPIVARGLPVRPLSDDRQRRWLAVDRPIRIDLGGVSARELVLSHFCDAWRDERGERPAGTPVGWVLPVGEPLARVSVHLSGGGTRAVVLRRRFEVNEGVIGWGAMAFLAVPHLAEGSLDWRGPHGRQTPGYYAAAGHAGPLTTLPGTWGVDQTGVEDHVPAPSGALTMWLHSIDVRSADGSANRLEAIELAPLPGDGLGRLVVVAGLTAFRGAGSALRWGTRQSLRVDAGAGVALDVDMGVLARRVPLSEPVSEAHGVAGWASGSQPPADGPPAELVELAAAEDAALSVGDSTIRLRDLPDAGAAKVGAISIERLPAPDHNLAISIRDAEGQATPARVRAVAWDGRILAPQGHRTEVNPAIYEDTGADLVIGGAQYAYVDGEFDIEVPADGGRLEIVRGPDVTPIQLELRADDVARGHVDARLGPVLRPAPGNWVNGDTHVHFLAPSTALLQARAEGANVVHLLATQWGDHHTNLTDVGADLVHPDGRHAVWVGSENRQNMLGHIGIVGTSRPVLPFVSGGPPEGPIGMPVTHLMADWLRRSRELGGLAIAAHFPLPMAEIAADIEGSLLDALELQCFDETLESPPMREWYRYLNAGYRLPLVGGTDKMSAEIPLGQVRTWARLGDDDGLNIDAWSRAIRAGRTFVSSGPILELHVDGREPGDELTVSPGANVEVELRATAAQPVIGGLEIVLDGAVVAATTVPTPVTELALSEPVEVERTGWLAGRSRSPVVIGSAFASAMAAHTSAVYVEVPGRPRARPDLGTPLTIVDGTRAWLEALAPVRDRASLERFRRFLDDAERRLKERG